MPRPKPKKKRDEKLLERCIAAARDLNKQWIAVAKIGCPASDWDEPSQADLDLATLTAAETIYRHICGEVT